MLKLMKFLLPRQKFLFGHIPYSQNLIYNYKNNFFSYNMIDTKEGKIFNMH